MTTTQFLIAVFALVICGLMLPLSYAVRVGLFLLLIGLVVMTLLGGGMHFMANMFD